MEVFGKRQDMIGVLTAVLGTLFLLAVMCLVIVALVSRGLISLARDSVMTKSGKPRPTWRGLSLPK